MKKSIFIASFILLIVAGWIGSGQFSNNVVAQDDNNEAVSETKNSYTEKDENEEDLD